MKNDYIEFENKYKSWRVLKFAPREGTILCPFCFGMVKSINCGLLPPYICQKDKVFFDHDLRGSEYVNKHVLIHGLYYASDLKSLFAKYTAILQMIQM
jgi:hypothetical protein